METLIGLVFEHLKSKKIIRTQAEFAAELGLTNSYISQLRRQSTDMPQAVQKKLHERFNISTLWLASNGKQGKMFDEIKLENTPLNNGSVNSSGSVSSPSTNENQDDMSPPTNFYESTIDWQRKLIDTLISKFPDAKNEAQEEEKPLRKTGK